MIILILIILSSCSTTHVKTPDPALFFPLFPDPLLPDGSAIPELDGGTVRMPLAYWKRIAEYVIEVESTREQYEAWRRIYYSP
jgi:hypothetical protein